MRQRQPNASFFPWMTAVLCAASLLATLSPPAATRFEYHSHLILAGEWYRLLTCHLSHWTTGHLGWSLITFAALGSVCEIRAQFRTCCCTVASALLIPVSFLVVQPSLVTYRGLSGIDSALFVLLAVQLLRTRSAPARIVALALVAFIAKVVFETVTGGTFFANPAGRFVPVPLAHLAGALVGLVCATVPSPSALRRDHAAGWGSGRAGDQGRHSPIILISTRFDRRPSNSP